MNPFDAPPGALGGTPSLPPPAPPTAPVTPAAPRPSVVPVVAPAPSPARPPMMVVAPGGVANPMEQIAAARRMRARRKRTSRLVVVVLVVALVAGGAFAATRFLGDDGGTPDSWSGELAPLAAQVEQLRVLEFQHPLRLEHLDPVEFDTRLQELTAPAPTSPDTPDQGPAYRAALVDAFGITPTPSTVGVDVAWLPTSDVLVMRGDTIDPIDEAAIVHELTLALLAQFAATSAGTSAGTGSSELSTAVIQHADAAFTARAYIAQLPPDVQASIGATPLPVPASAGLPAAPWPMLDAVHAPFTLGGTLVENARNQRGVVGSNDLLRAPPDEYAVMNPWTTFSEKRGNFEAIPRLPIDAVVIEQSKDLTGVEMLVALDAWLPWTVAGDALLGWVDGTYTTYRTTPDGPLCAAVAVMVPSTDSAETLSAFTFWTTAMGSTGVPEVEAGTFAATGSDSADTVHVQLCERGATAPIAPPPVVTTVAAMMFERSLVPVGKANFVQVRTELCTAAALIDDPVSAPLVALTARDAAQAAQLDALMATARQACAA